MKNLLFKIASVGISQFIGLLSPLLISPLIIKEYGLEKFGELMFCQTIMNFLIIIVDYSFNITATKELVNSTNNALNITKTLYVTTVAKFFLTILSFVILCISLNTFDILRHIKLLGLLSFTIVVGRAVTPTWLMIGLDKNKALVVNSISSKIISFSIVLFILYKGYNYEYINFAWGIGDILVGTFTLSEYFNKHIQKKHNIVIREVFKTLLYGKEIFFSNIMNAFYLNSSVLYIGMFSDAATIGMYSVAEKIIVILKQIFGVLVQATYPYACSLYNNISRFKQFLKAELICCASLFTTLGIIVVLEAHVIVKFYTGEENAAIINYLKLLSFVPLIVSMSLPAYQTILISNYNKGYVRTISLGFIMNILLGLLLTYHMGVNGTIISIYITESVITLGYFFTVYFKLPNYRLNLYQRL